MMEKGSTNSIYANCLLVPSAYRLRWALSWSQLWNLILLFEIGVIPKVKQYH